MKESSLECGMILERVTNLKTQNEEVGLQLTGNVSTVRLSGRTW